MVYAVILNMCDLFLNVRRGYIRACPPCLTMPWGTSLDFQHVPITKFGLTAAEATWCFRECLPTSSEMIMNASTTPFSDAEDNMELMYPEEDDAADHAVGVNSTPPPSVDWFSVGRDCCGPPNTVGKDTAGAAAPASPKKKSKHIFSSVKTFIVLTPYRW